MTPTRVTVTDLRAVAPDDAATLRTLVEPGGTLRHLFAELDRPGWTAPIALGRDADGALVAWSAYEGAMLSTFVRADRRRRGHGTAVARALVAHVRAAQPGAYVRCHADGAGAAFYQALGIDGARAPLPDPLPRERWREIARRAAHRCAPDPGDRDALVDEVVRLRAELAHTRDRLDALVRALPRCISHRRPAPYKNQWREDNPACDECRCDYDRPFVYAEPLRLALATLGREP